MAEKFGTIVECNAQKAKHPFADRIRPDAITLFCEDRKKLAVLGEFGGDGYPAVWYGKKGSIKYGMTIAADGVGNGAFIHKSLQEFVKDEKSESDKLKKFLTAIYGEEFFKDEEAVEYAVKSFCSLPPNSYYGTNTELGQVNKPFYDRDSQYLSSRLVCIAIFHKFRNFFEDKDLTPETVATLRRQIQTYLDGVSDEKGQLVEVSEFRKNILTVFDNVNDGVKIMDRIRYFLPCTASMWFFKSDESNLSDTVKACVVYAGDARAYKVDLEDGVMQISVDDAEDDGAMTCCIRYCSDRNFREDTGEHDCALKASYVEVKKPCALFACSDGVYDTCLPRNLPDNHKLGIPAITHPSLAEYQSYDATSDISFEYNYQEMLRKCYTLDDILVKTAKHIYYHTDLNGVGAGGIYSKVTESGNPYSIKRDDSATMAMVFFGMDDNGFPSVLTQLRKTKTSLDRLIDELNEGNKEGKYSYCKPPQEDTADTVKKEVLKTFTMNKEFNEFLKKNATEDSAKVCKSATQNMWGLTDYPVRNQLMGMSLDMFLKPRKIKLFNLLLDEAKELKSREGEYSQPAVDIDVIRKEYTKLLDLAKECEMWQSTKKQVDEEYEKAQTKESVITGIKRILEDKKRDEYNFATGLGRKIDLGGISDGEEGIKTLMNDLLKTAADQAQVWDKLIESCQAVLVTASSEKELVARTKADVDKDSSEKQAFFNSEISSVYKELDKLIKKRGDTLLEGRWQTLKGKDESSFFAVMNGFMPSISKIDFKSLVKILPEDLAEGIVDSKLIPDGWDESSHVLHTKERYDEFNSTIKAIVSSLEGAWEIDAFVEKETAERLENSPFKKVSIAYENYINIAYAKRGDSPLVKGDRYESIYQTFNRGIKR